MGLPFSAVIGAHRGRLNAVTKRSVCDTGVAVEPGIPVSPLPS